MRYTVMIVEPDLVERKEIIRALIYAGYDALPVTTGTLFGELCRLNDEVGFEDTLRSIIISDNIQADYVDALHRCLLEIKQIAVIGYGDQLSAESVTYKVSRSTDQLLILLRDICAADKLGEVHRPRFNFAVQNDSQYLTH